MKKQKTQHIRIVREDVYENGITELHLSDGTVEYYPGNLPELRKQFHSLMIDTIIPYSKNFGKKLSSTVFEN